jgi:hypothetical protein
LGPVNLDRRDLTHHGDRFGGRTLRDPPRQCARWCSLGRRATLRRMATDPVPGSVVAPLESWEPLHPAAVAAARDEVELPPVTAPTLPRSAALAEALAAANRAWGNEVDSELARWLAGAEVVVTGQQPGLLGGPLLTLIKAAAVAGQVRRLRSAGREAVGFLWLGTGDDDLAEMGWGRVVAGDELLEVREPGWTRGSELGGTVPLGGACASFLQDLETRLPGANSAAAIAFAVSCYREGATLGDASARFLGRLLAGCGVVLVDALEVEVARAALPVVGTAAHIAPETPRVPPSGRAPRVCADDEKSLPGGGPRGACGTPRALPAQRVVATIDSGRRPRLGDGHPGWSRARLPRPDGGGACGRRGWPSAVGAAPAHHRGHLS